MNQQYRSRKPANILVYHTIKIKFYYNHNPNAKQDEEILRMNFDMDGKRVIVVHFPASYLGTSFALIAEGKCFTLLFATKTFHLDKIRRPAVTSRIMLNVIRNFDSSMVNQYDTIEEGNKILAEFEGFTYYPENSINGIFGVLQMDGRAGMHLDTSKLFHADYHSNLESLNRVWVKFRDMEDMSREHYLLNNKIGRYLAFEKIETTWLELVKAVTFYNNYEKQ